MLESTLCVPKERAPVGQSSLWTRREPSTSCQEAGRQPWWAATIWWGANRLDLFALSDSAQHLPETGNNNRFPDHCKLLFENRSGSLNGPASWLKFHEKLLNLKDFVAVSPCVPNVSPGSCNVVVGQCTGMLFLYSNSFIYLHSSCPLYWSSLSQFLIPFLLHLASERVLFPTPPPHPTRPSSSLGPQGS